MKNTSEETPKGLAADIIHLGIRVSRCQEFTAEQMAEISGKLNDIAIYVAGLGEVAAITKTFKEPQNSVPNTPPKPPPTKPVR